MTAAPDDTPLTFEESRRHADANLIDALADLRHHTGLTKYQYRCLAVFRARVAEARRALELAATHDPTPKEDQ